jgi:hypothetical protein
MDRIVQLIERARPRSNRALVPQDQVVAVLHKAIKTLIYQKSRSLPPAWWPIPGIPGEVLILDHNNLDRWLWWKVDGKILQWSPRAQKWLAFRGVVPEPLDTTRRERDTDFYNKTPEEMIASLASIPQSVLPFVDLDQNRMPVMVQEWLLRRTTGLVS